MICENALLDKALADVGFNAQQRGAISEIFNKAYAQREQRPLYANVEAELSAARRDRVERAAS